jgi:putative integral membrane protein (TIGR02587 family)
MDGPVIVHDAHVQPTIGLSLKEYGRGLAGGLLFSLPMLYTQEMWRAGGILGPERLLVGLLGTFLMLLGYNRFAGLRCDASLTEVAIDSVEELGLGLALAALLLAALGQIDLSMSLEELVGRVVVCGLAVAIGVSVGTAQLGGATDEEEGMSDDALEPTGFAGQMALALCGAVLVAANIAPTGEIPEIAGAISPVGLLALSGLTLAVGAMVLHFSEFVGADTHTLRRNDADRVTGVLATYLVSLIAATALLWFFGRFAGDSPGMCLAQVVVLGLPTAIGASAGRLLLQSK